MDGGKGSCIFMTMGDPSQTQDDRLKMTATCGIDEKMGMKSIRKHQLTNLSDQSNSNYSGHTALVHPPTLYYSSKQDWALEEKKK